MSAMSLLMLMVIAMREFDVQHYQQHQANTVTNEDGEKTMSRGMTTLPMMRNMKMKKTLGMIMTMRMNATIAHMCMIDQA
eukprot:7764070-Pyramimonas_sp.AAC.1